MNNLENNSYETEMGTIVPIRRYLLNSHYGSCPVPLNIRSNYGNKPELVSIVKRSSLARIREVRRRRSKDIFKQALPSSELEKRYERAKSHGDFTYPSPNQIRILIPNDVRKRMKTVLLCYNRGVKRYNEDKYSNEGGYLIFIPIEIIREYIIPMICKFI
jgi:hypothetical protein